MNPIAFLKAAYIVAWVVYVGYLARILLRMKKVEEEMKELQNTRR
jgi:CcmD family protein